MGLCVIIPLINNNKSEVECLRKKIKKKFG